MAGAVGKARDGTRQIVGRVFGDGCGHAGGAEGYGYVTDRHAQSQRSHGVVAAARCDQASAVDVSACDCGGGLDCRRVARSQYGRQDDGVGMRLGGLIAFGRLEHHGDQVAAVFAGGGIVIDGAGSVGTVGEQGVEMGVLTLGDRAVAGNAPAQPVVRQADGRDLLGVLRFVFRNPGHLGQRVGGDGGGADGLDPALLASGDWIFRFAVDGRGGAHLFDQGGGLRSGAYVIPQHGVTNHVALPVQNHHAMLLSADGQGFDVIQSAGLFRGLKERIPPIRRVDGCAVWVLRLTETHQLSGFGVGHAHLAGLGRGIDAGHEFSGHYASLP